MHIHGLFSLVVPYYKLGVINVSQTIIIYFIQQVKVKLCHQTYIVGILPIFRVKQLGIWWLSMCTGISVPPPV